MILTGSCKHSMSVSFGRKDIGYTTIIQGVFDGGWCTKIFGLAEFFFFNSTRLSSNVTSYALIENNRSSSNFTISKVTAWAISQYLEFGGPLLIRTYKDIVIESIIPWTTDNKLTLVSKKNIIFGIKAGIHTMRGQVELGAGIENPAEGRTSFNNYMDHIGLLRHLNDSEEELEYSAGQGKVIFEGTMPQIIMLGKRTAHIYYNPEKTEAIHKYQNPYDYSKHVYPKMAGKYYMLVSSADDLQHMYLAPNENYALSRNISAANIEIEQALFNDSEHPFRGSFDGNGYEISNFEIYGQNDAGLFGSIEGQIFHRPTITNLRLSNIIVYGDSGAGSLCGKALYVDFINITLVDIHVRSAQAGALCGSTNFSGLYNVRMIRSSADHFVDSPLNTIMQHTIVEDKCEANWDDDLRPCVDQKQEFISSCKLSDLKAIMQTSNEIFNHYRDSCLFETLCSQASNTEKFSVLEFLAAGNVEFFNMALGWVVWLNDIELTKFCLERGADPNEKDGWSLAVSVIRNLKEIVFNLLRANATFTERVVHTLKALGVTETVAKCIEQHAILQQSAYESGGTKETIDQLVIQSYQNSDESCTIFDKSLLDKYHLLALPTSSDNTKEPEEIKTAGGSVQHSED